MKHIARRKLYYDNDQADYRRLFDESPIPMWIYNSTSLRILAVNAAAVLYYGYSRDTFLKMTIQDLRPKEDISTQVEIVKIPMLNSFYDSSRRRHVKKNGEVFYVQAYSHATQFAGRPARVMLAMDINNKVLTEQRNQELNQVIREHKNRLDDIMSSVSEVIWSCKADGYDVIYINDACEQVYGYKPAELTGDNKILFDIVHPDDVDKVKKAMNTVVKEGKAVFEYRIYHKNGTLKYITNQAVLKRNKDVAQSVINGVAVDITRLRVVEEALLANMHEMQTMLESITDGFFAVNAKWEFTYANKESELFFDQNREKLLGRNIWDNINDVAELAFSKELHRAMETQVSVHFEDFIPSMQKWLSVNAYPSKDGLAVYFSDITTDKERQIKIEAQNKMLIDIAWIQSHKIRGPVANILGLAQLFNYDNPADPINKEILDGLKVTIMDLDEVIKDVVDKTNTSINPS